MRTGMALVSCPVMNRELWDWSGRLYRTVLAVEGEQSRQDQQPSCCPWGAVSVAVGQERGGQLVRSLEIRMRRMWCLDAFVGAEVGRGVGGYRPEQLRGKWESLRGREGRRGERPRERWAPLSMCVVMRVPAISKWRDLVKRWIGVCSKTEKSELGVISHKCNGSRVCSWTFPVLELVKLHPPSLRPASRLLSPGVLVPARC